MTLNRDKLERVKFLSRVIKKEIHHLNYSASKVFNQPFTIDEQNNWQTTRSKGKGSRYKENKLDTLTLDLNTLTP